jgi:H+/Cl- antiporter ClcA
MKKIFLILAMVLMLAGAAVAADWANYSGQGTTSAAVTAKPGYFYGIIVSSSSVTAGSISVYDNATAASGSRITPIIYAAASATSPANIALFPSVPVKFFNGIYVSASSTAGVTLNYELYYKND